MSGLQLNNSAQMNDTSVSSNAGHHWQARTPADASYLRLLRPMLRGMSSCEPQLFWSDSQRARKRASAMLWAGRFAMALGDEHTAIQMTRPMTYTAIRLARTAERESLHYHLEAILAQLSDQLDTSFLPGLRRIAVGDTSSNRSDRAVREFGNLITAYLGRGEPAILLLRDLAELPASVRSSNIIELDLPPIDAELVSEMLRITHGLSSRLSMLQLSALAVPVEELPVDVLLGVFCIPDVERVFQILSETAERLAEARRKERDTETLDSLCLPDDLSATLNDLMADLGQYREGALEWRDVSASILLHGPPGCGKSSIPKALAASAGLHFVAANFAQSQATGHLGNYLESMEARYAEALRKRPSVFFIDEFDSFVARDSEADGRSYMRLVVNHMLELLTRLNDTPGIVVMAATNDPTRVDPALLRAGRFDAHIHIARPDRDAVVGILRKRLAGTGRGLDLARHASDLVGMSGADIAAVATQAISLARRLDTPLSDELLAQVVHEQVPAQFRLDIDRIALHEAGHAVVQVACGLPIPTRIILSPREAAVETSARPAATLEIAVGVMITKLGGRAAEAELIGSVSAGASLDIEQATQCAFQLETRDGLLPGKIPLHLGYDWNRPECWPEHLHDAVARWMSLADRTAQEIVRENADVVTRLAERLKADRELSGKVLADLLSEASPAQIQLSPYERQRAVAT